MTRPQREPLWLRCRRVQPKRAIRLCPNPHRAGHTSRTKNGTVSRNVVLVRISAEVYPEVFLDWEMLALARRHCNGGLVTDKNEEIYARGVMDLQLACGSAEWCEEGEEEANKSRHCVLHHLTLELSRPVNA